MDTIKKALKMLNSEFKQPAWSIKTEHNVMGSKFSSLYVLLKDNVELISSTEETEFMDACSDYISELMRQAENGVPEEIKKLLNAHSEL